MAEQLAILKRRTFLLGVGAQKAGTTWLSYYLHAHPQVMMSPIKEMHFFGNRLREDPWPIPMFRKKLSRLEAVQAQNPDEDLRSFSALRERIRMGKDAGRYRRFFRKRVKDEPVFGEITPAYCNLDGEEFEFIRSEYPNAKIVFLLRNPADRMWSQMRFSEKFETLEELESRVAGAFSKPVYYERYDYVRTIRNLRASFDASNIHFEFYERLFTPEAIESAVRFSENQTKARQFFKRTQC